MTMWVPSLLVSLGVVYVAAINIPIQTLENTHKTPKTVPIIVEQIQSLPIYYASNDNVDSYLVHPNPHKPEEVTRGVVPTPATYLLPPSPDKQNEYFVKPTEPDEQTEWYPIAPTPTKQQDENPLPHQQDVHFNPNEIRSHLRDDKLLYRGQVITVPSRNLLPPSENSNGDFVILSPSPELELPSEEIDHAVNRHVHIELPILRPPLEKPRPVFRIKPESGPVPFIRSPGNIPQEYKNPTRLYPKKYINEFKPIPIPVSQYEEESDDNTSTDKSQSQDTVKHRDVEDEENEQKRKRQKEDAKLAATTGATYEEEKPSEQEVSESNHRHHENHIHTHPRKGPIKHKSDHKSKGERTEFRMHGMKGPNSYQFGYDTGKGKNRQFRYEERDNDGHVRGHYGYVDKFGKLRVVNYDAHPELGFRAEAPVVTD